MRSLRVFALVAALSLIAAAPAASIGPPTAPEVAMTYDVIEEVASTLVTNFNTDMAALTTAKGVTALASATVHKRLPAAVFAGDEKALPGIGVYSPRTLTQAKNQARRHSTVTVMVELHLRGTVPATLRAQAELAQEAILLTVDRLWNEGSGLFGAGEEDLGVECAIDGTADTEGQDVYEETVRVSFTVQDEDAV